MSASQTDLNKSVLVALDGSPAAKAALPVARAIARQIHARLVILHVAPTHIPEETLRQRLDLGAEIMEDVELHIHQGGAAAGILRMIEDPRVFLTVLTTHGRNIEPGRSLGRVAEAVIAATSRPVMLVRPEAVVPYTAPMTVLRCMLFPLDGTPTTASGFEPVTRLASTLQASVDVLYVANPEQQRPSESGSVSMPSYVDQPQHEWPEWANEVMERLAACAQCPKEVSVRVYLAYGNVEEEIIRFAVAHNEDVIALVRKSHMEPGRARVLRAVLNRTPCPVLLTGASPAEHLHHSASAPATAIPQGRR